MNQPIKWQAPSTKPVTVKEPERPGLMSLWTGEGRLAAQIERNGRTQARQEIVNSKLRMLQGELRRYEARQIMSNAQDIMDEAERLAAVDPGRAEVFADIALAYIRGEMSLMHANHHPLFKR